MNNLSGLLSAFGASGGRRFPVRRRQDPKPGNVGSDILAEYKRWLATNPKGTLKDFLAWKKANQPPKPPAWNNVTPGNTTDLLRQLSVNAGKIGMPGAPVGAVAQAPAMSGLPPVLNPNPATYGQGGEARFFTTGIEGGMVPLDSLDMLGVPAGWNPLGTGPGSGRKTDKGQRRSAGLDALGGGGRGNGAAGAPRASTTDIDEILKSFGINSTKDPQKSGSSTIASLFRNPTYL